MASFNKMDELILKYLQQPLSETEQEELNTWISASPENRLLFERLTAMEWVNTQLEKIHRYPLEKGWQRIAAELPAATRVLPGKIRWIRWAAAAAIFLLIAIPAVYLLAPPSRQQSLPGQKTTIADLMPPMGNKARIVLADGTILQLDSLGSGQLALQGKVQLVKNDRGEIVYRGSTGEQLYNTLFNPRGSRPLSLTLGDGSRVWLNAGSSLKYPVAFQDGERKVEISGEAYFEVAKDPSRKFAVIAGEVRTEVLGTHFNVNAYKDDGFTRITLLEGSVKVVKGAGSLPLKPGEQAQVAAAIGKNAAADTAQVMAWKNGFFYFNRTSLDMIMQEVSRWYDAGIIYETEELKTQQFTGQIARMSNASEVIRMLEMTGAVHFAIEGNKIRVKR